MRERVQTSEEGNRLDAECTGCDAENGAELDTRDGARPVSYHGHNDQDLANPIAHIPRIVHHHPGPA